MLNTANFDIMDLNFSFIYLILKKESKQEFPKAN